MRTPVANLADNLLPVVVNNLEVFGREGPQSGYLKHVVEEVRFVLPEIEQQEQQRVLLQERAALPRLRVNRVVINHLQDKSLLRPKSFPDTFEGRRL